MLRIPRRRGVVFGAVAVVGAVLMTGVAVAVSIDPPDAVGTTVATGIVLPTNQTISPLGQRIKIDDGRLLSSTLNPTGRNLAALTYEQGIGYLSVFDVRTGRLIQQLGYNPADDKTTAAGSRISDSDRMGDGTVAADGPLYSPDGRSLWVSQTLDVLRYSVLANGTVAAKPKVIKTMTGPRADLPSGGVFSPDGKLLYLALNNANALAVIDTSTDKILRKVKVGVAPRQVALANGRLFVSDEGGRTATAKDFTNLTSRTAVVADRSTGAVNNGTVSVVNPTTWSVDSLRVGLEPTALYVHGNALFVANSNDDSISVIDTGLRRVVQTINVNPLPGSTVGSYPNAITMLADATILVSIGRDNAIAVYHYGGAPSTPVSYQGLIPTDWYPVNVQDDPLTHRLIVTNDKGVGARGVAKAITNTGPGTTAVSGLNTYSDTGTLTTFAEPTQAELAKLTHTVFVDNGWDKLLAAAPVSAAQAAAMPAQAIPTALGAPSTIKHVFLIVKENRTYDQVLGDIGKGDSDPALAEFGAKVTPNEHALADQFGLFDNYYDEGTLSADGHNWLMQADANDYIEKEFGAFYRSYPAQGGDALAYQRDGFLWNAAEAAGNTVRDFGEYNNFFTAEQDVNRPSWSDWYQDSQILEGKAKGPLPVPLDKYRTYSDIPSLNAITDPEYPRFDFDIPDQYRTDIWLKDFQASEKSGKLANLNLIWLPGDHTAGTTGKTPYPTAAVADNDLAVGRVIDTISHSKFWASSAVFVVEDDSQFGVDHVDGHRAPVLIASPYARRGVIDGTYYSQLNVIKTIEQILGIAPMNQEDRAAVPMYDAFTDTPNLTAFTAIPNKIPLTLGVDASLPPLYAPTQKLWQTWSAHQQFGGAKANEDQANSAQLNRLDWYQATGWSKPYPGDLRIYSPYQVPGWDVPPADTG
ncbi:alkaline phosphatase family protein [Jatrophihabitans sp.]|uniref:bifunctional YncE family protein/alkaline phosphatase family protein n=1 Tax=Jatrophihabitans sp. TaxID=1932789 RepID=UPI0030C68205|nr:beta-propeller repeat protein [Jatrophihabitans sp.]